MQNYVYLQCNQQTIIMGVSIKVHKNVSILEDQKSEDYKFIAYNIKDFKDNAKNLEEGKRYTSTETFCPLSYPCSLHNDFRTEIYKSVLGKSKENWRGDKGWIEWNENQKDEPFYEFLNFADNEGTIDWEASENLYMDFATYEEVARENLTKQMFEYYQTWLNIFMEGEQINSVITFS